MTMILSAGASLAAIATPAAAREAVEASAPTKVAVTVYRDPNRQADQRINRNWPQGFAMISETRTVTLPPGESTIRFSGVAEGMVAVTAIVTGLPGGTIEKNRNADLLSPAALVDGTLGNRVTITRTNPATGKEASEIAIIRSRADGGLVLQTEAGYEAVRCAGIPERIDFSQVPAGLSAQPVFSIDTRALSGGTYTIVLTYLAWGFDWQAHYVATLADRTPGGKQRLRLRSWLTIVNDNGQTFPGADLQAVAGKLNVESNYRQLSDPPTARPLRLTCYPLGSTATGSPVPSYEPVPPPPPPAPMMMAPVAEGFMARTASAKGLADSAVVLASEEALGDLKLYRVPQPVDVAAKAMKQVAFLDRDNIEANFQYRATCAPFSYGVADRPAPLMIVLRTVNDKQHGLGIALPNGGVTLFQPSSAGELLVGEQTMRDYAAGQDVELELGASPAAFIACSKETSRSPTDKGAPWIPMKAALTNANGHPVAVRILLGAPGDWQIRGKVAGLAVREGQLSIERNIPAGDKLELTWQARWLHGQ